MKKNEITAGLMAGMATILVLFIAHQIEPIWMLNPILFWGTLIFYFLGMMGACLLIKRQRQGILPFKNAVSSAFLTFLVANLVFYVFYYFMFNVFDPNLSLLQKDLTRAYYEENFNAMELRRYLAELEETEITVDFGTIISGFVQGAIGGFLLSLIVGFSTRQAV